MEERSHKIYFLHNYRLYYWRFIALLTLSFSIPVWSNTEFNLFNWMHDWIITCKYPKIYYLKFTYSSLVSYGLIFNMSASYKMFKHSTLCDSVIWPTGGCLEHHVAPNICLSVLTVYIGCNVVPFSVLVQGDILNPEYSHSDLIPDATSGNQ